MILGLQEVPNDRPESHLFIWSVVVWSGPYSHFVALKYTVEIDDFVPSI